MAGLPSKSVLVRTWFGDERAWWSLVRETLTPGREGYLGYVTPVNDPEFEDLGPDELRMRQPGGAIVSFLADEITLTHPEHPVLAVWVLPPQDDDSREHRPFRVVPAQLWSVENNINQSNLGWEDFTRRLDGDGVYRGDTVVRESDFGFDVRSVMAQRLAHLTPGFAESLRAAGLPEGAVDLEYIPGEAAPEFVRERLTSARSFPAALSWDWCAAFDVEHARDDRARYLAAFLEEIGERTLSLGTVLASVASVPDYYLALVAPDRFEELSRLFTDHHMRVEIVRRGCFTRRITPEQRAAIRAWAEKHGRKVSVDTAITARGMEPAVAEDSGPERFT